MKCHKRALYVNTLRLQDVSTTTYNKYIGHKKTQLFCWREKTNNNQQAQVKVQLKKEREIAAGKKVSHRVLITDPPKVNMDAPLPPCVINVLYVF